MHSASNEEDALAELWQSYAGQGVSEDELTDIEAELGNAIPATYRTFLALAGDTVQAVPKWIGSDWLAKDLVGNHELAQFLLEQNPYLKRLPLDAFVFWGHQGYSVQFVRRSLGDASPVYGYLEGDEPLWRQFRAYVSMLDSYMLEQAPELWRAAIRVTTAKQKKGDAPTTSKP